MRLSDEQPWQNGRTCIISRNFLTPRFTTQLKLDLEEFNWNVLSGLMYARQILGRLMVPQIFLFFDEAIYSPRMPLVVNPDQGCFSYVSKEISKEDLSTSRRS